MSSPPVVVADMTASGFEELARDEDWPGEEDADCVVFRRPGVASAR